MQDEEKDSTTTLAELMTRKRKLTELRNIKLKEMHSVVVNDNQGIVDGNSVLVSNEMRSISPPPFSPLTLTMMKRKLHKGNQGVSDGDSSPLSNVLRSISPPPFSPLTPLLMKRKLQYQQDEIVPTSIENDNSGSPLPIMSPRTEELYHVLINDPKIINYASSDIVENSEVSGNETDDSIRDPDFNVKQTKICRIDESETDCDSLSGAAVTSQSVTNTSEIRESPSLLNNNDQDKDSTKVASDGSHKQILEAEIYNSVAESIAENNENIKKRGRSRKERKDSKRLRNSGKSYVTEKGKRVPERQQKNLNPCRLKCAERFSYDEQRQCFENYWKLGDRDRRAAFVSKSVSILPKKSQMTGARQLNRDYFCQYRLEICNVSKPICKECFCRILGETKGFINVVIEKKKDSPTGIIIEDQRGRNPPKNKKTIEDITIIKNHIMSFPSYESHYCRKATGKKYLPADLSIAKMYREYRKSTAEPASVKLYAKSFHDLNLAFKQPSKDTCNTCDVLNAKIKVADENRKQSLMAGLTEHQNQAEKAYAEKRIDKERAKTDQSFHAFAFDLQQCLPTPYLKTSVSFYKRQLWSFNLTLHDLATNEATCYMWDETVGGRGANQIASCLWHFCQTLPPEVKEITFYSDTCGGQNKNNVVAMMFIFLLNSMSTLQKINHKFLLSGHTHMECDSDHAVIEKAKKRTQMKINHLYDWVQLVRTCKVQKPFKVVVMTLLDFLDFTELKSKKGPFTIKKINDSGQKFLWQPIKWLQYNKDNIGLILYKDTLCHEDPFQCINLKKRGKVSLN